MTAIDWLINELKTEFRYGIDLGKSDRRVFDEIIAEAKQIEKAQIMKSYKDHHDLGHIYGLDLELYYKETHAKQST